VQVLMTYKEELDVSNNSSSGLMVAEFVRDLDDANYYLTGMSGILHWEGKVHEVHDNIEDFQTCGRYGSLETSILLGAQMLKAQVVVDKCGEDDKLQDQDQAFQDQVALPVSLIG